MPTIDELLGPVAKSPSIVDLLGPEPPSKLFKQPEPSVPPAEEFLDANTFWKTEGGRFQRTKQTSRERLIEERNDVTEQVTPEKLAGQLTVAPLAARGGLKQTLAGILRAVNAPPILAWLYSKSAENDTKDAEEFSKMIGGGKAGKTVMEFGSTGIQSLPALAAAPAGLLGMAVTAGAQTFGSVTEDAYQTYKAKDDPEALNKARLAGGLAGVVTAGLTRYIPGGTERFAQALVKGDLSNLAAQGMVKTILKEAAQEFPEEALDQVSQGVIAKFSYRPETTWQNIGEDAVKAGLMGSALAGLTGTVALPVAKGISRLRRGSAMRESISTDEPQSFGEPLVLTKEEPIQTAPQVQAAPIISGAPAAVAPEGTGVKAVVAPVLPPTDVPNRNPLIQIEGPDGKLHWFTMDGYQDFTGITLGGIERGVEPQLTAVEASPGKGIIKGGTTYGYRLTEEGYKLPSTLPTTEEIAAHRAVKTEAVAALPVVKKSLTTESEAPVRAKDEIVEPFQDWRVQGTTIRHSSVGKKLTEAQAQKIMSGLAENGMRGRYVPANGTVILNSGVLSDLHAFESRAGAIAKRADKSAAEKSNRAAEQQSRQDVTKLALETNTATKWIDDTFGADAMNNFNKLELAKYLEGTTDKFGGATNPKWRRGLEKLGVTSIQDIRSAFQSKVENLSTAEVEKSDSSGSSQSDQKFRIGRSPQTFTLVEELPATPIEITNNEQVVRVKNERTGEVTDVLKSQLVPVNTGTGVKATRDLNAELTSRKLDPSVFPNAKAKRAAIERHDALNKRTNRQLAEEIAGKLEGLKSGKRPGDLHLFGVVSLVWDTALTIVQKTFEVTGSVADAVKAAIDYIRANNKSPFDEAGASEFFGRAVEPSTDFVEPEPDEADEPSEGHKVNIAGRTYDVISKDGLTPEQREAGDAAAQATFQSMGIPGIPDKTVDKRPGSIDNNTVWRVVPDGQNHDAEAEALREHLIEQIQIQNSPEGDASYVSSLINAINMNFDHGRWRDVISQPVLESLLNVSVGESSKRGTLLRQIRGISNDMRAIAQNVELRLKWVYAKAFDPEGLGAEVMRKVREEVPADSTPEQRKEILRKVLESLSPEKRDKIKKTPLGKKIEKAVEAGALNDKDLFKAFAKENRWSVPTDKEIDQMREWVEREKKLATPTPEEIAKLGEESARAAVEAATLDVRKELLRKMNTQWSQWTQPVVSNWRDLFDPEKVKNTNTAFNEWVAANLLLKIGFGTRQVVDVGTQMVLNTPTRALGYAFENWAKDISNNRDSNLQHSIAESITDAYRTRIKVLIPALQSFKQTLKGKGEQRQVEQLISSIGIFDRMLLNAAKMRAEGKRGAANLLQVVAIGMRMGRQFAAAMDVVHGIPAEAQEIAHLVRNGLREKGLSKGAVEVQFNEIMGLLATHRAEALSLASEMLSLRGEDTSSGAVERAAWHILRDKIYNAAQQAELNADDWKKQNALYRDLIGWNLSETKGMQGIGGPGGLVALGGKAAKEMFSKWPLVGGLLSIPFTFSNAMGISVNRKLAWSPLGFFPGMFKGSPHWEGEANIRQRKVEAAIGTGISGVIFTLIISGVWKALPSFWPKDEKERDKWVKNGWSPGMVLIPWGNGQELHLSTRTGPLAFFAPTIAAAAAYTQKQEDRAKKQAEINQRAAKLGVQPEQLPDLGMADWMGVMGMAAYSSLTGGRTASGAISAYTDYGTFNVKKAAASELSAFTPGLPAINEFARLTGGNVNPKLASFWDMLVPMPTSKAQRVNVLGDPMRDENDYRRIFTILSGGNFPFPTSATPAETQAYAALFGSDYRPPSIDPSRGYQISGKLRPFNGNELQAYTTARGQEFKRELASLGVNPATEDVKAAYTRANQRALTSVGVTMPSRKLASTPRRTSSRRFSSRLRGGRSLRLRGRRGLRANLGKRRRRRLALR